MANKASSIYRYRKEKPKDIFPTIRDIFFISSKHEFEVVTGLNRKNVYIYKTFKPVIQMKILSFLFLYSFLFTGLESMAKPRVFVFTDINIGGGDPDDRQSLIHLLWYADELDIVGIVPDRWNKQGLEACLMAIESYEKDYEAHGFGTKGFPSPYQVNGILATDLQDAERRFLEAGESSSEQNPLYVLVWGNMENVTSILKKHEGLSKNIRLITIGTGIKFGPKDEVPGEECNVPNWNGPGRNELYDDTKFRGMWWLEINWTYNGMFSEPGPKEMFEKLGQYGHMGQHIRYVTKDHEWAQYFRVGDTPSVLYLLDPRQNFDDPTQSSWAGKFTRPFPEDRPNYYTDDHGPVPWNYKNPCETWINLIQMYSYNKSTLESQRPSMYAALLDKLGEIYER